jgi:transcriptional regulator with XRE-family HTH domain
LRVALRSATLSRMASVLPDRLAQNLRALRSARGLTQARAAKLADVPRATWTHLESGAGNPTLEVLHRVALSLEVSIEELVCTARPTARHYPKSALPERVRGVVHIRKLLPHPLPGVAIERLEIPRGARLVGVPHTPGTTEYLTCEAGQIVLVASGTRFVLERGDVVVFRGDQKHAYLNETRRTSVGYSVVLLGRGDAWAE